MCYADLSDALRRLTDDRATLVIDGTPLGRVDLRETTIHLGHLHLDGDLDVAFRLDRIRDVSREGLRFVHHRADGRDETVELALDRAA